MVKYWMFRRKSMEAAGQRADSSSSNGGSPLNRSPKVRSVKSLIKQVILKPFYGELEPNYNRIHSFVVVYSSVSI